MAEIRLYVLLGLQRSSSKRRRHRESLVAGGIAAIGLVGLIGMNVGGQLLGMVAALILVVFLSFIAYQAR